MARERTETGEYIETVTLDRVREAVRGADDPIVTTNDVADVLDCTTEAARQKLLALHDRGEVARRTVGARAVVWWLAGDVSREGERDIESAADRVGGRGLFTGEAGEAFTDAVEASREEFNRDYEDRHDDLFGQ